MVTEKKMTPAELASALDGFSGTCHYYMHSPAVGLVLTDGAKFLADHAKCYWLMDLIASYQPVCKRDEACKWMQFWSVERKGKGAVVKCERDLNDELLRQEIEYSDFPLDSFKLYVEFQPVEHNDKDGLMVVLLPGEH